jgi:hypothetical protein
LQTLIENLACFLAHNSCVALNNIGNQTMNIWSNVGKLYGICPVRSPSSLHRL